MLTNLLFLSTSFMVEELGENISVFHSLLCVYLTDDEQHWEFNIKFILDIH